MLCETMKRNTNSIRCNRPCLESMTTTKIVKTERHFQRHLWIAAVVHWKVSVQGQLYHLSYLIPRDQKDSASIQILRKHSIPVLLVSYFAALQELQIRKYKLKREYFNDIQGWVDISLDNLETKVLIF